MFEENNQHAREIPGQCQQRNFTQVPAEFDLFQSHRHYACGRSDNQQAASHAGAESQQMPEDTVLYERLHISRIEARAVVSATGYMPIQAATSGTLSITADSRPVIPAIV